VSRSVSGALNLVSYGPAGFGGALSQVPPNVQVFSYVHQPGDLPSLCAFAYAVWHDLVHRKFIATLRLVPDDALIRTIARVGPYFNILLTSGVPSHNLLYIV
jgi:hypothetical protein